ncbi:hypothetical protein [Longimicrobium sp.]|uniref:hypothetical protein n=1 Tax=Longimicrobium sp. TaxID=2029185 RepID=UPI002C1F6797|nr:hypothetical protein [Longimicrobium sp.]HSU12892.1 hypothetical protein [Longimicrobium sp.]
MADISVERKPRSPLPMILAILLVAAIAVGAWWYMTHRNADGTVNAPAVGDTTGR